ncbi:hypothetical protein [Aquimarina aquimarini]|uniref:hypothetical protein n=1 Tax=Aquimarina aquimarini TaxID=1191734 RepID=UPI000D54DC90|nr:hypothetical protein [Aquimarina aquimarini]
MKIKVFFLSIGSMFLTLSVCAQNSTLKTQLQLLQKPPTYKFVLDSTGFSKIKDATFFTINGDTDVFNINSENIHLVDFTNDGQKDIIYQDTRRYQATVLLAKKGNDFFEIWSGPGALVDIQQGEQKTIYVLSSPIGCFNIILLSELIMKSDNTFITENTITLHPDVKLNKLEKIFKQEILSGILRTQPIINDEKKKDPCTGDFITGNQIRTIKNKEVMVIKKQKEWLLVALQEKDTSIIGWIKK